MPVKYDREKPDRFYVYYIIRTYNEGYSLPHVAYVGKGESGRYLAHLPKLEKGKHRNKTLQEWYNKNDSTWECKIMFGGHTSIEADDKEAYEISKRKKSDSMKAAWARRKAAKMGEKLAEAAD
jgi:hypothetical protein